MAKDDAPVTRRDLQEALTTVEAIEKANLVAFFALVGQLSAAGAVDVARLMTDLRAAEEDARKRNERDAAMKALRSYRLGLADVFQLPDDPEGR